MAANKKITTHRKTRVFVGDIKPIKDAKGGLVVDPIHMNIAVDPSDPTGNTFKKKP